MLVVVVLAVEAGLLVLLGALLRPGSAGSIIIAQGGGTGGVAGSVGWAGA